MSEVVRESHLETEDVRSRIAYVLAAPEVPTPWSVRLLAGRSTGDGFELRRRGVLSVTSLEAAVSASRDGTQLRLKLRTARSRYWRVLVNLAVISGGVVALGAVLSRTTTRDFGIDVLVPLLSVIFTVLIIFVPAFWWMVGRHAGAQARWLLDYLGGLLADSATHPTWAGPAQGGRATGSRV